MLGVIDRGFPPRCAGRRRPSPLWRVIRWSPGEISVDAPLLAEVIRTTSDPYAGRLSMVRVFNGTLRPDTTVHIAGHRAQFFGGNGQGDHDDEERVGLLTAPHGVELHPKEVAIAGEVVMVAKLGTAETSDTLSDPMASRVIEPWLLPEPLLPSRSARPAATTRTSLRVPLQRTGGRGFHRQAGACAGHRATAATMGQAHQDLLMNRLKDRYGTAASPTPSPPQPQRPHYIAHCHRFARVRRCQQHAK